MNVYSLRWPIECITDRRYVPLMEAQVVIHVAGGVAESIHRGDDLFDHDHCDNDLDAAAAMLRELFRATGVHYDPQCFSDRAFELLTTHWGAVEALASALIVERRVGGARVSQIIDHGLSKVAV
jgi:hypothetical protein